jgi:quercetin dioxygenase-like cupin family protein
MAAYLTKHSGSFDEPGVLDAFARERLSPQRWSNGPGHVYAPHRHSYHKVLYCPRGSITFRLGTTGEEIALVPGDRLDIEPGTEHSATVGANGVECIEAARS